MLTWNDIEKFIKKPNSIKESQFLECKKATNDLPRDFWKSFSAFSNTEGGFILLGISEDKENNQVFKITGVKNPQKIVDDLFSQIRSEKINVNNLDNEDIKFNTGIYLEKNIIAIYVKKAENNDIPVHLNGELSQSYKRFNSGDHKLTAIELKNIISSYSKLNKDSLIIKNTSLEHINLNTLEKYKNFLRSINSSHKHLSLSNLEFLKSINAYGTDFQTGEEGLTYSGILMFGKVYIIRQLQELSHYFLEYQEIEDDQRYSQRITIDDLEDGNLFEFYLKISYLLLNLAKNNHFKLDNLTRIEENQITEALREALVNTLTHADYFNDQIAIRIIKNKNQLIFENPGAMLVSVNEAINGVRSCCRNSTLHNIFRTIGLCERQGKGIETIFLNWNKDLLTTPELTPELTKTTLKLILQDGVTLKSIQILNDYFGSSYVGLKKFYKNILIFTVINDLWINHQILLNNFRGTYTGRDITLALAFLEKKEFLKSISKSKKRNKLFILPWVNIDNPKMLLINQNSRMFDTNNNRLNEQKIETLSLNRDEYGRIIKGNDRVLDDIKEIDPNFIEDLKKKIPVLFSKKQKKPFNEVKKIVLELCQDQFISSNALCDLLKMSPSALSRHLKRLTQEGFLKLAFPHQITHQEQSYKTINNF